MPTHSTSVRFHYLDGLRAGLILLGIPYHSALAFTPQGWLVKSSKPSLALQVLAEFIHAWRMPTFFLIAGLFATWLLARKDPWVWLRGRLYRLGYPLVAGVLILNLPTVAFMNSFPSATTAHFDLRVTSVTFLSGVFQHLWFLLVLVAFSCFHFASNKLTSLARAHLLTGPIASLRLRVLRQRMMGEGPMAALALMVAILFVFSLSISWGGLPLRPIQEAFGNIGEYLAFYCLGVVVAASPGAIDKVSSAPLVSTLIAFLATAGFYEYLLLDVEMSLTTRFITAFLRAATACIGVIATLSVSRRWFDREDSRVSLIVSAALVIYLVHQPIVLGLDAVALHLELPTAAAYIFVTTFTLLASLALYEVLRRSRVARLLFNGSTRTLPSVQTLVATRRPHRGDHRALSRR